MVGVVTLLLAATGVVIQLKDALNTVWEVKPAANSGIWNFIRTYLVSLAGLLAPGISVADLAAAFGRSGGIRHISWDVPA